MSSYEITVRRKVSKNGLHPFVVRVPEAVIGASKVANGVEHDEEAKGN